eukprot:gene47562-63766_t
MSRNDTSWEGDYSLLLHGVEGYISNHVQEDSLNISVLHSSTRKRACEETSESGRPIYSLRESMKITVENDELKLIIEKLRDDIVVQNAEFEREKDRFLRQFEFMEADNLKLKKSKSDIQERYYEEKKKWQQKVRNLDVQIEEIKVKLQEANKQEIHNKDTPAIIPSMEKAAL